MVSKITWSSESSFENVFNDLLDNVENIYENERTYMN